MKIFNLATFTALLAIAYSKGSEAKEPSQLIGKAGNNGQLEPINALMTFLHLPTRSFFGGGAILSKTSVIAPFIIFNRFYEEGQLDVLSFRAVIGQRQFHQIHLECNHYVYEIKHNIGPDCDKNDAIALVIIKDTSDDENTPSPSKVQHIPLATRSYIPGQHSVSESIIGWDEQYFARVIPISYVNVDNKGIISAQIRVGYRGKYMEYFHRNLGAFITRKGTLAGLAFKHEPVKNVNEPVMFYFLPIHGNNNLIKDLKDKGIQIKDIDLALISRTGKKKDRGSSSIV